MAAREGISRKFLYRQKRKAEAALDQAFVPFEDDPAVLFYLPVTAAWLTQLLAVGERCGSVSGKFLPSPSRQSDSGCGSSGEIFPAYPVGP